MLKKLQKKWGVSPARLVVILLTFALGGSLCGWLGKWVMAALDWPLTGWTIPVYILIVTLLWPLCVITVSIPMGQFVFFRNYLRKMAARITGIKKQHPQNNCRHKIRIAVFASGAGSNARNLMEYFAAHPSIDIAMIACNKAGAGVLSHAAEKNKPVLMLEKENFFRGDHYVPALREANIDWIVLAGFLWKIPQGLIAAYPNRIINIHPALLPKFGGKGMYGHRVHEAVIAAGETESGITIHWVDEQYDHGATLFQAICSVEPDDTPDSLAAKVQALEHAHFPRVVEKIIGENNQTA